MSNVRRQRESRAPARTRRGAGSARKATEPPLCVDLDGTLIRTDLLVESYFAALKRNVLVAMLAPFWLLRGRAYLKHRLSEIGQVDCGLLPYHAEFVEYLRAERSRGRRLVLVTASHERYARQVADHLKLFDEVFASNERLNLSGHAKRRTLSARFGVGAYDYAGNGSADLKVFRDARRGILVEPEPGVERRARNLVKLERTFSTTRNTAKTLLRALRLHQWLKNTLVFVPLLVAHKYTDSAALAASVGAFVAFGLCASATYLLNDYLDLASDRAHPRKRLRPLASGELSPKLGTLLVIVLSALAFALAAVLSVEFAWVLLGYLVTTLSYSLWLKRKILVDVMVLAGLYTLRILAGAAVVSVIPSFWLLAFSMFLFLSLAMVKRYTELFGLRETKRVAAAGRGYLVADIATLQSLGAAAGYLSVLVLALYIHSADVQLHYRRPEALWLLCPILLYWISRMWQRAGRGSMHDDPLMYAVRDRVSRWIIVAGGILVVLAALV